MVKPIVTKDNKDGTQSTGPKTYQFKKKRRKDLVNAMQIVVFSMTDAELDKKLRKEVEEAVKQVIAEHKDSSALAYTIVKE